MEKREGSQKGRGKEMEEEGEDGKDERGADRKGG